MRWAIRHKDWDARITKLLIFLKCSYLHIQITLIYSMIATSGFICFIIPNCVFSYVSSSRQPELMHSRTGCICLTFLHCAFSNVSSNCLCQWMHNHTGCNDLAFLRCGFSYVSSMWLPERKLYRTGCTFLTFQSLDPSLVQISKREERDNCSV